MEEKIKKFTVRLNENDYYKLRYKAREMKLSRAEFIRELIRKSLLDDIKEYNEMLNELRKLTRNISNNINQLSRKVNSNILFDEVKEAEKLNEELKEICQLLKL